MIKPQDVSISEATRVFISQVAEDERPGYQQELGRFLRWYGRDRLLNEVTPPQVDDYVQEVQKSGGDYQARLLPLRNFLAFATVIKAKKNASRKLEAAFNGPQQGNLNYISPEGYQQLQEEVLRLKALRP